MRNINKAKDDLNKAYKKLIKETLKKQETQDSNIFLAIMTVISVGGLFLLGYLGV